MPLKTIDEIQMVFLTVEKMSLRTSPQTGVAIRSLKVPDIMKTQENHHNFGITDCHVAALLAMTSEFLP